MCYHRIWAVWEKGLYDLTDYVYTQTSNTVTNFDFLNDNIAAVFKQQSGQDVTQSLNAVMNGLDALTRAQNINCLKNAFYVGETDFRKTARCQAQNYFLLVFSGILMTSMVLKCKSSETAICDGRIYLTSFQSWPLCSLGANVPLSCKINSYYVKCRATPKGKNPSAGQSIP